MGFEQLEKDVIKKVEKNADKIVSEAEQRAKAMIDDFKKEEKEMRRASEEKLKERIDLLEKKEMASSKLEAKKNILMTKKEIICKAFEKAKSDIDKRIKKTERKKLIEKLVSKADKEIDVGIIYCNKADLDFVKGAKERKMAGGIIAESKDGSVLVDYSFETLIDSIQEKHISEISGILFGKNG